MKALVFLIMATCLALANPVIPRNSTKVITPVDVVDDRKVVEPTQATATIVQGEVQVIPYLPTWIEYSNYRTHFLANGFTKDQIKGVFEYEASTLMDLLIPRKQNLQVWQDSTLATNQWWFDVSTLNDNEGKNALACAVALLLVNVPTWPYCLDTGVGGCCDGIAPWKRVAEREETETQPGGQ